ncbi:exportin-5-like [Macrosteles quadrilineatus]|uniref:exportin-5-like n=1 Tax=Macrosteles quadrilineatus TaxID=74068 RepID=UPI0023E2E933|nr:exportin-5-like [Macrosteles quadrilineatus]
MCSERPPASAGLQLLEFCLALDSKDPLILSLLLTCISALLVFLNMVPAESATNYLPGVLDKIFNALVFEMPVESRSSDSIKNIHHHAASLIVKMAQKYSPLLLPFFDRIKELVTDLEKKAVATSILEFTSLKEALLLINNQFCDYERQREFVGEVLRPVGEHWRVMTSEVFTSTEVFMAFVGLDKPPVEPSKNDTNFHNRFQIMYTVDVLSAVVRHCTWPDDPERALTGGFVIGRTDSGDPIYRNPATPHLLPLLPGILNLIKMFNSLWTPEAQGRVYPLTVHTQEDSLWHSSLELGSPTYSEQLQAEAPTSSGLSCRLDIHCVPNRYYTRELSTPFIATAVLGCLVYHTDIAYTGYEGAHAMLEEDRNNLLGIPSRSDIRDHYRPQPSRTALHRMQCFLSKTNECCYQILSHAFPSLSHDLYHMPHLAQYLIDTVMHNLENIPDYRLRILLRRFFKPFFASCPSDCYDTVLVPVLARFTPFMFLRLDTKWQHIIELQDSGSTNKKCTDVEEVLEDMLIRELTRKYLKVLKLALIKDSVKSSNSDSTAMEQDCEDQRPVHSSTEVISELGLRLLQCDTTCQAVTLCLLSALSYNDSESSATAACLVGPVLSQLVVGGMMNAELASNSITSVLQGLQLHAQHEYNEFSLVMVGTQLYELLRPLYPQVLELHGLSIGQMFKRKAAMEEAPRT